MYDDPDLKSGCRKADRNGNIAAFGEKHIRFFLSQD